MAKNVIKELIIILLLCLVIILVLGILLYEYVPMSKTIPNPVSYTTPEEVQKEISNNEDEIIFSFDSDGMSEQINSSDLNNYEKINNYQPGKADPFSSYQQSNMENDNTIGNSGSTVGGNTKPGNLGNSTSSSTSNNTSTSGGEFFPDKGIK